MKTPNGRLRLPCPSVGRLSRVVLVVALVAGVTTPARAAGVINHQEIVERAIRKLEASGGGRPYLALLQSRRGFVYYGSMFPDWGMAYRPGNQEYTTYSEVAHDTPYYQNTGWRALSRAEARELPAFWRTLLAHVAPRPLPASDSGVAFLFGLVSHQVSDGAFHFSQANREEAFQPKAPDSHFFLELGLDAYFHDFGYIRQWAELEGSPCGWEDEPEDCVNWSFPLVTVGAIREAYAISGYPDPDGNLYGAVVSAPSSQAPMYRLAAMSPTTVSAWATANWEAWESGGMTDMVNLTIDAWEVTWSLLDTYEPRTLVTFVPETADGNNGWYRQPVSFTLKAEDTYEEVPDYGKPFQTYYQLDSSPREEYEGEALVVSAEGQTTITLSSVDAFENVEPPNPVVLKIDRTPPVVIVTPPSNLTRVQLIHFGGNDPQPGSGLLSVTAVLNQQPVTSGQVIDPFWWTLGSHSLDVTAEDNAGWLTNQRQNLELIATIESLLGTVSRLCQQGYITQPGICNGLSAKLDAALAARNHGNLNAMAGALNAFQNAVNAQAGKAIADQAASLLLADSAYVLMR